MESLRRSQVRLRSIFVGVALVGTSFWLMVNRTVTQSLGEQITALFIFCFFFAGLGALYQRAIAGAVFGVADLVLVATSERLWPIRTPVDLIVRTFAGAAVLGLAACAILWIVRRRRPAAPE